LIQKVLQDNGGRARIDDALGADLAELFLVHAGLGHVGGEALVDEVQRQAEFALQALGEALDRRLIDRIVFYIAPVLLGGPTPALGGHGVPSNESALHLNNPTYRRIGPDLRVEGEVQR
jgi:hypothetical protein